MGDVDMEDYDRRQLELMLVQIAAYRAGKVDLSGLISNLEVLSDLLQGVPDPWRDRFKAEWAVLEIVYAVSLHREEPIESPANQAEIEPAVGNIKNMNAELLAP